MTEKFSPDVSNGLRNMPMSAEQVRKTWKTPEAIVHGTVEDITAAQERMGIDFNHTFCIRNPRWCEGLDKSFGGAS